MMFYCFGEIMLLNLNYCSLQQDILVPVSLQCTSGGIVLNNSTDSK
jgi:hypothetical protein